MKKIIDLRFIALSAFLGLFSSAALAEKPFYPGRILMKPAMFASDAEVDEVIRRNGAQKVRQIRGAGVHVLSVPPAAERGIMNAMRRSRSVEFVELDVLVEPDLAPNDPYFGSGWHLAKMEMPQAWDLATGGGIRVAVLDTGFNTAHPDLAGQFILPGRNTVDNSTDITDNNGHGTWVAGTIAALTDNGVGVSSIAPNARLIPIKVSNLANGAATASDIAEGIVFASDNGAKVANASYGISDSLTVQSAAAYMKSRGGLVVISAGNDNANLVYDNPADIITVGATDSGDARASFSNYGAPVDVSAPGVGIYTTDRSGGYSSVNGTSFSSPATAAVIALIMQANPALSPSDVETVLLGTADNIGIPSLGAGRVNAYAAVQGALALGSSASIPAQMDFNGDGRSDILWKQAGQANARVWLMNGHSRIGDSGVISGFGASLEPGGFGDFNGDGNTDILWRDQSTGANWVWLMNGTSILQSVQTRYLPNLNWQMQGTGDFNGDGNKDILWYHSKRQQSLVWLMDGGVRTAFSPEMDASSLMFGGIGDFNGDGNDDIIWRNRFNGDNQIWMMDGIGVSETRAIQSEPDLTWEMLAVADFNNDGQKDVFWRRTGSDYRTRVWIMNGSNVSADSGPFGASRPYMILAGVADYNGDGNGDIFWRNSNTGTNVVWLMNGTSIMLNSSIPVMPDLTWRGYYQR